MSNIYISEPPTSGKVLLKTTVGDIDVELWAKETPKTCRNFIQLCLEGYYNNTDFHRVVKGFIVQGGDPTGDGTGGESIYGETFKDEFHQRLRFTRRGLLAMANAGKNDNGSQFFFTLGPTPELQNKHTLFGKVTGETIFNMLKLEEGLIEDEKPVYPHKIIKAEFNELNFKLLSFGEEAEEDEEESTRENEKFLGKGKSTHDVLDDPKLSSKTDILSDKEENENSVDPEEQLENIRKKLKTSQKKTKPCIPVPALDTKDDDEDLEYYLHKDRDLERKRKMEDIKKEIQSVKRDYHKNKLRKEEEKTEEIKQDEFKSETYKAYKEEYDKYKSKKELLPKKGSGREKFTLDLLEKFKRKLQSAKEKSADEEGADDQEGSDNEESWLSHKLKFEDSSLVLAKDANTKDDDWFEIYDPRNPLNKRRRGENTLKAKK
ncbi:hypothetical protein NQ314_020575 [Rhamnusium bicolor]|uniref:Spliceosome-associated protein CWC27 homolog n=1 Tax=Rhamnusium bicolor TaxID=1586634 RepID=A0AAV8WLP0_9CUCU|nr:hypothetical protein NQ314_020575 [Rhamnusium bicolor]